MQICLSNLLRTNLPLMWLFPWVELPPSHYVFQRTSMRGDIFISCACLTEGHWAAWCSCLRVTHKHLCALSVPVCIFRHKPLENHFVLATWAVCVLSSLGSLRDLSPQRHISNTYCYRWLKFIPVSCNWSIWWHSYGVVMTLFCIRMFFRLKCEFWRLRL